MKRREFMTFLGGAAAWPLTTRAQRAMPVIGYLGTASAYQWAGRLRAFRQGLSETGFEEDRNVVIEYRWAENHYDRLRALAADLVGRGVNVLVAPGSAPAALVAKAASTTIPIVFETGADPVAAGIVGNLSRPGGNITGITALAFQLGPKRLELLHELVPAANPVATVFNPTAGDVVTHQAQDMQAAARALRLDLVVLEASSDSDIDTVFANLRERRAGGLVVIPDAFTNSRTTQFAAMAPRQGANNLPVTRFRRGGRPDELRWRHFRIAPSSRCLYGPDSQG
jgi:putative ABC transport system substrate-binding protein